MNSIGRTKFVCLCFVQFQSWTLRLPERHTLRSSRSGFK